MTKLIKAIPFTTKDGNCLDKCSKGLYIGSLDCAMCESNYDTELKGKIVFCKYEE